MTATIVAATVRSSRARAGFSLLELLVVLAITMLLTGLLMPAMSGIKENARRVICSAQQRQLSMGMHAYATDYRERLPYTAHLPRDQSTLPRPHELMMSNTGVSGGDNALNWQHGWDGIGLLYWGRYCDAAGCFYCPSHRGSHSEEDLAHLWDHSLEGPGQEIYTNYHYGGDMTWGPNPTSRRLHQDSEMVLLTDGLRTRSDFNHRVGMNVVAADGSVRWIEDQGEVYDQLPLDGDFNDAESLAYYNTIWQAVEATVK